MRENDLLASLPALFASADPGVVTGSGPDDCAHVAASGRRLAFSVDVFAEGSHFLPDADPADVAWKALAASASDLAASACRPRWALVGLCLKKGAAGGWAGAFARALAAAAGECGLAIVGGDTVSSPDSTFVSVTVVGEPLPGGPVLRGGGRPGDALVVTGSFGGSILGKHLRPRPRQREVELLMQFCEGLDGGRDAFPTAAMDVSDGLALDLSRLCRESGTGAVLEEDSVPIAEAARRLAEQSGRTPLRHALSDGEDFELLLALPPATWEAFSRFLADGGGAGLAAFSRIGVLADPGEGLRIRAGDGSARPLDVEGFQHLW